MIRSVVLFAALVLSGGSVVAGTPSGASGPAGTTLIASGFVGPTVIAADGAGNVYVADHDSGTCVLALSSNCLLGHLALNNIYKIDSSGNKTLYFDAVANSLYGDGITGLAVNPTNGTLAIGPFYGYMYTLSTTGTLTYVSANFNDNRGMVFDSSGNLYFANDLYCDNSASCGLDRISAPLSADAQATTVHATAVDTHHDSLHFRGVAIDASHNYFVTDMTDHSVYELSASNPAGAPTLISSDFTSPQGIVIDPSGNLYVADYGRGIIYKITPAGAQSVYSTAFSQPYSLAMGPAGLYVLDLATNSVYLINGAPSAATNVQTSRTSGSITVSWTPSSGATSYTCTLMTGFNVPTSFKVYSTSPQCVFNGLDPSTPYGVQVVVNGGSTNSSPVIGFANIPPVPTTTTTVHHLIPAKRTITCVKGSLVKHIRAVNPRCPVGYQRR